MQIASDTPKDKNLNKTDNALSEYNILQLSSELYFTVVKILKFPMCKVGVLGPCATNPACVLNGLAQWRNSEEGKSNLNRYSQVIRHNGIFCQIASIASMITQLYAALKKI